MPDFFYDFQNTIILLEDVDSAFASREESAESKYSKGVFVSLLSVLSPVFYAWNYGLLWHYFSDRIVNVLTFLAHISGSFSFIPPLPPFFLHIQYSSPCSFIFVLHSESSVCRAKSTDLQRTFKLS